MNLRYDVAVVGAGPAGLAAAATAAAAGASVALLDEGDRPGGQFFRHDDRDRGTRHHRWRAFTRLRAALTEVDRLTGHRVWHAQAGPPHRLHCLVGHRDERPVTVTADRLVLATGAHDRVLPFPGWDLPGVLTAGAAQALWKAHRLPAGHTAVVAGTGPFLLPVAEGLAAAGAHVTAVYEAARPHPRALRPAADPARVREAIGYAAVLARHRIPYRTGRAVIAAHGTDRLESVTVARVRADWRPVPGTARRVACDTLAVGHGFTPRLDLAAQLGCPLAEDAHGDVFAAVDAAQATGVPGVYAAGEITGIAGADTAMTTGALAAHAATGTTPPTALLLRRAKGRRHAAALAAAWPVGAGWRDVLTSDTIVCRCEEVPYAAVAAALADGARDPRTVKLLCRAGMGYCQGRVCGPAIARLTGAPDPPRRTIAQPIRLRDLAATPDETQNEGERP